MPNIRPKKVKTYGEAQAGITPLVPGQPERVPWVWYDLVTYTDNTTVSLDAFGTVQANKVDGNMESAGQIPAPMYFDLFHIGIYFHVDRNVQAIAATPTIVGVMNDISRLIQGTAELIIAQKTYYRAPIWMFPPGGGMSVSLSESGTYVATNTNRTEYAQNGSPDLRNRNNFWGDITIPHNQSFTLRLAWAAVVDTVANVGIKCAMDGFLYRRVL